MKKNHSSDTTPVNNMSLADVLEESSTLQWLTHHGLTLFFTLLGALVAAILIYKMAFGASEKSASTFINAENAYQSFISKNHPEDLQKLNALIKEHPELHAKYDALIAQDLISQGKTEAALPYAQPSLKRTNTENSPFYISYAESSLLIGEKKYAEALSAALALKDLMKKDATGNYGDILYGLNIIRIGMLQKELGLAKDEAALWKEWKDYAVLNKDNPEFKNLTNYFQEGKISLIDYIEVREKLIEKH